MANAGGPYYGAKNIPITLDGSGSSDAEGAITYFWEFVDRNSSTQKNPSHIYTADGTFNVTLTVTDAGNLKDADFTTVTTSSQNNILSISSISPNSMLKGQIKHIVLSGSGFDQNASIQFSGEKYSPMISNKIIIDQNTIEMDVTSSSAGPRKNYVYDVTVTNPNGTLFPLFDSFTVIN